MKTLIAQKIAERIQHEITLVTDHSPEELEVSKDFKEGYLKALRVSLKATEEPYNP